MPNSILNINTKKSEFFHSREALSQCIEAYFTYVKGEYEMVKVPAKKGSEEMTEQRVCLRELEPPTISGLAYFLGFSTRQAFDRYEVNGKYKRTLMRSRLKIEAEYEKRLHLQASAGAMFALKALGWHERADTLPLLNGSIKIELVESGALPAASEAEVQL